MAVRQEHVQSYQFGVQRVVAALVAKETDPAQPPFRRLAGATLVGVLLAALGVGGAAAYALLRPGDTSNWRDDKALIVEQESGALFVYREPHLHPVLNQASALLLLNTPDARTVTVSRARLRGAPRGAVLGIPGAPASLPPKDKLRGEPWMVCSTPGGSVLFIGSRPGKGQPLGERGVLATSSAHQVYLIWRNQKHLVRQPDTRAQVSVAQAVLHAIPSGADADSVVPAILDDPPATMCVDDEVTMGVKLPDVSNGVSTAGGALADTVVVPPGGGALVRTDTGVLSLVTDLGRRHAVPDEGVLPVLGYAGAEPVTVPAALLGLLPAGPALDPVVAGRSQ
ncbi:type VII secretion protein EccB [Dactylosporangium sp. AC04546]|uniref:type VII secretion protein EccB n=1 Tax=Dactylosporangium sp. AC04546 TaxID=2862460 RepID=UPI001EDD3B19|nr:type VII secretion protein EccB [Dactylosporangium sp. AC04546]WVK84073.1 type VII secretion protein EccB [Dactylosporangium sp. AC04546]